MNKKYIIIFIVVIAISSIAFMLIKNNNSNDLRSEDKKMEEQKEMPIIKLDVNENTFTIQLENNSSSLAFLEKLKEEKIIVHAQDYGNFEKVGDLGFTLPTNDEKITTKPGDLILYQGNKITLYYDTNTWAFTKLGGIENVNPEKLKNILGKEDVTLTFYIDQ